MTAVSAQKRDTKFGFVLILGCLSRDFEAYTLHFPLPYLCKALGLRGRRRVFKERFTVKSSVLLSYVIFLFGSFMAKASVLKLVHAGDIKNVPHGV